MVELRWLERWRETFRRGLGGGRINEAYRVLQYRQQTNLLEYGLHDPIWSDWIDVPLEAVKLGGTLAEKTSPSDPLNKISNDYDKTEAQDLRENG